MWNQADIQAQFRERSFERDRITALCLLCLAVVVALALRLIDLDRAGLANLFYASAIRSMGESWHHFFYAAYDPAASISVDKPPLALWLQVLSWKILGFSGFALILPMAIAGTIGVVVSFLAARKSHGLAAGVLAALVLAVFPESVATSRDTTMDAMLMLVLVLTAWQLVVAVEEYRPWRLVLCALLLGLAFNIKFFQAFVILPAATVYVVWRYRHRWRDLRLPLVVAIVVGSVTALAWISAVELTPVDDRPLVMNDRSNSAYGLAFRYNGIERVLKANTNPLQTVAGSSGTQRSLGMSRAYGIGNAGPLRLLSPSSGALMGFGVSLALGGLVVAWLRNRPWFSDGPGLFWGIWLVTGVAYFSVSHRAPAHYTEAYVPAIAVLAGVGLVEAWRGSGPLFDRGYLRRFDASLLLPALCGLLLAYALVAYNRVPDLRIPGVVIAVVGLVAVTISLAGLRRKSVWARSTAVSSVLAIMLITSSWVAVSAPRGGQITNPNPIEYMYQESRPSADDRSVPAEEVLAITSGWLPDATYRFATTGINDAGEAIARTGASVLPIWNNYLAAPVFDINSLREMIGRQDIPAVLVDNDLPAYEGIAGIRQLLTDRCKPVTLPDLDPRWSLWNCVGT